MAIKGMTEAEIAYLTPEERAALEDFDPDHDPDAEAKGDPDNNTPIVDEEVVDEPEAKEPAKETKEEPESKKTEPESEPEPGKEPDPKPRAEPFVPMLAEGEKRDYDKELEEIRTARDDELTALKKKFEDGDIAAEEYTQKQLVLITDAAEKRAGIVADRRSQQQRAEFNAEMRSQIWRHDLKRFLRDNDVYKSPIMQAALNRALEQEEEKEGGAALDNDTLLENAHREVLKVFGLKPKPEEAKPKGQPVPKPGEAEARANKIAPRTLAEVPAADDTPAGADPFVHLDNLDGIALERELAKLSETDQERYLSMRV